MALSEAELESHNETIKDQARKKLEKIPRMQISEHKKECLKQLDDLIEQKYMELKRQNQGLAKQATTKEIVLSAAKGVGVTIGVGAVALGAVVLMHVI